MLRPNHGREDHRLLRLEHVHKRFGPVVALADLRLKVPAGTVYGLIGPNGAGKTTTMRIILGIVEPDAGTILWHGKRLSASHRKQFSYVPEERGLFPRIPLKDQMIFFAGLSGLRKSEVFSVLNQWVTRLELEPYVHHRGSELSKGNARKAQLAIALIARPDLVVLDEPFEGLDPVNVRLMKQVLRKAVEAGTTVLLSSHTMEHVEDLCTHVALIDGGRAVLDGSVDAVRRAMGYQVVELRLDAASDDAYRRFAEDTGLLLEDRVSTGGFRFRVPEGDRVDEPDHLWKAAGKFGTVAQFQIGPPSLEEVYVTTVSRNATRREDRA